MYIYTHLPQIESNCTNICVSVQVFIRRILWIVNFWVDPFSFICRIWNLFWFPLSLNDKKFCLHINTCKLLEMNSTNYVCTDSVQVMYLPCIPGCLPLEVPTRHPFHHPNHQAFWHLGQECARVDPSLLASCHLGHQWSRVHPNLLVSWPQGPTEINKYYILPFI